MQKRNWMRTLAACLVCSALLLASACGKKPAGPSSDPALSDASSTDVSTDGSGGSLPDGETSDTEGTVSGDPASGGPTSSQNPGSSGSNGTRPPDSSGSVTPPPAPADGMALDIIGDSGSPVTSTFFGSVEIEERNTYTVPSNGDLWPGAWSDDDYLYTANGDGPGFGSVNSDIAVGRLKGTPATGITRQGLAHGDAIARVWSGSEYNRKPTGMVSVGGVLYMAVQDLRRTQDGLFDDAPAASIYKSTDKGRTWTGTSEPMFKDYVFTTIMFLDYGKDNGNSPDGYVYAYGLDYNWRDSFSGRVTDPTNLYLARVPGNSVQDRSKWEFFSGTAGSPSWSRDVGARKPVLSDSRRVYEYVTEGMSGVRDMTVLSQGSIVYNKALNRYIYTSWTEYTYEFYESPTPYGPFKLFAQKDFGCYPWTDAKYGGYGCVVPSKFISADGLEMYIVSTTFVSTTRQYQYNMRKMTVSLAPTAQANNGKSATNLARDDSLSPVVISKSNGNGRPQRLNDGSKEYFEQSWTGESKNIDFWGYSFNKICRFNTIEYTTGEMKNNGGWFNTLGVQVRKDGVWTDVSNGRISPDYAKSVHTGQYTTYTITFDECAGDAIRIIGRPGGARRYTTVAELAVYYR